MLPSLRIRSAYESVSVPETYILAPGSQPCLIACMAIAAAPSGDLFWRFRI